MGTKGGNHQWMKDRIGLFAVSPGGGYTCKNRRKPLSRHADKDSGKLVIGLAIRIYGYVVCTTPYELGRRLATKAVPVYVYWGQWRMSGGGFQAAKQGV